MLRFSCLPRMAFPYLCAVALRCVFAFGVLPATTIVSGALYAQAIPAKTGIDDTWQGTLHVSQGEQNHDVRTLLKIVSNPDKSLTVTMYNVDQPGANLTSNSASFQSGELKYEMNRIDLVYDGRISADGKTITGEWKQGNNKPLPLIFVRATPDTAWGIPEPPKQLPPMPKDADPTFDVATIKLSPPDQPGKLFTIRGDRVMTINTTLMDLIKFAYDVQDKQVINAPDWADSVKYDTSGQPDIAGRPNHDQMQILIRKLLADRFQFTFHKDKREMSAYILTVAKGGPKMQKSTAPADATPNLLFHGLGNFHVDDAPVSLFCSVMQAAVLDRPVVDQTGLMDRYSFILKWTPDESQFAGMGVKVPPPSDTATDPPLFTAVQEQLGLKLDSGKTQVPVLVLDKVTKPSEN